MENSEEILQRMEQRLTELEEQDRKRRIRNSILWICVIAALAILAIVLTPKINSSLTRYNESLATLDKVVGTLDGVDTEKLSETLKVVSELDADKIRSIPDTLELVGALDGADIEKLSETLKAISEVDADKIHSVVGTINEVSELLEPIKGLFN